MKIKNYPITYCGERTKKVIKSLKKDFNFEIALRTNNKVSNHIENNKSTVDIRKTLEFID